MTTLAPHPTPTAQPGLPAGPAGAPRPARVEDAPIYVVPTLLGALAVLAGSTALSAAVNGSSWVLPLVEVVTVVWLVGIGCRLIRLPATLTVVLQVAGVAIALTALFTTGGYAGVIPNLEVLREFGALLSGAWHQILVSAPPAPSTPELSFLIALALGISAIIVDFLIAEAHAPALVALPLLCLYSVPASIAETLLPWWTFVAPAALYAMLLAVSGHPGRQRGARAGFGLAASGLAIIAVTTLVTVLVADTLTVVGTAGRLPRTGTGTGQVGLSPFASLHGNLERSDPVDLLQVTGLDQPDYLRTVALTVWTPGEGWSPDEMTADASDVHGALPGSTPADDAVKVTINSLKLKDKYLPIYADTTAVTGVANGWNYDQALSTVWRADAADPGRYQVTTSPTKADAAALREDSVTSGGTLTETGTLPRRVTQLAKDITAGKGNAFDKADAILDYFTDPENGFQYSLNVPVGNTGDALTDFLENKQGYCEQYASAMAIMLRAIGIPSRVAIGFTQGTEEGDSYVISSHDAHAWVEVLFDEHGWVRFDPTPLAGNTGGVQGFEQSAAPTTESDSTTESDATTESLDESTAVGGNGVHADTSTALADGGNSSDQASQTQSGPVSTALWWALAVMAALALVVAAPSVLRGVRRRRRLATAESGRPGSAAAAWAEIEDLCVDHGIALRPSESARSTANRLARTASLNESARSKLRALVVAVETEWYAGDARPAPVVGDGSASRTDDGASATSTTNGRAGTATAAAGSAADLVAAVRAVDEALDQAAPLTLADKLLPRSVRPSARD